MGDIGRIEDVLAHAPSTELSELFADWSLTDYARLYLSDLSAYPNLASRLPTMPSEERQRQWTGNVWSQQIPANAAFVRAIATAYESVAGRPFRDASVVDYGAGWGRFTRLMLGLLPAAQVIPADVTLGADIFDALGFPMRCVRVDSIPERLPWSGTADLVFLYSVLTHLPLESADAVLGALRPTLASGGLLAVTIRPESFWTVVNDPGAAREHRDNGYAFRPTTPTWGDTSMTLDFVRAHWPGWRIWGTGWHAADPAQTILYLRPT